MNKKRREGDSSAQLGFTADGWCVCVCVGGGSDGWRVTGSAEE